MNGAVKAKVEKLFRPQELALEICDWPQHDPSPLT
jgi:hypothetical protein